LSKTILGEIFEETGILHFTSCIYKRRFSLFYDIHINMMQPIYACVYFGYVSSSFPNYVFPQYTFLNLDHLIAMGKKQVLGKPSRIKFFWVINRCFNIAGNYSNEWGAPCNRNEGMDHLISHKPYNRWWFCTTITEGFGVSSTRTINKTSLKNNFCYFFICQKWYFDIFRKWQKIYALHGVQNRLLMLSGSKKSHIRKMVNSVLQIFKYIQLFTKYQQFVYKY
jgi:hypothetical protein